MFDRGGRCTVADAGLTEETGAEASVGLYYDISNTTTVEAEASIGCCATIASTSGSINNETRNTFRINTSYTASYNRESSRESHREWSEYNRSTLATAYTVEAARVQVQVDLANIGTRSIDVANLSFIAYALDGYTVRPFAALRPPANIVGGLPQLPTYTLAPGERLGGVILSDLEADAGRVAEVMRDPHRVLLSAGTYTLRDTTGLDYDFHQDLVNKRTSRLTIDWGPGRVEHLDVATSVDRLDDGTPAGMPLRSALDLAGVRYEFEQVGANYYYTLDDRPTVLHEGPAPDLAAQYDDPMYTIPPGARAVRSSWTVFIERYDGTNSG